MSTFQYGNRTLVLVAPTKETEPAGDVKNYIKLWYFCNHFGMLTPPAAMTGYLLELEEVDVELRRRGLRDPSEVLSGLQGVRVKSPAEGGRAGGVDCARAKLILQGRSTGPALVAGYWPDLHAEQSKKCLTIPLGTRWQIITDPDGWQAGVEIYGSLGPLAEPALRIHPESLTTLHARLASSHVIDKLAEWAKALT